MYLIFQTFKMSTGSKLKSLARIIILLKLIKNYSPNNNFNVKK